MNKLYLKGINVMADEYIPPDISLNFLIYRCSGMWSPLKKSHLYTMWTTVLLVVFGITYPLSLFINICYVKSIEAAVDVIVIAIPILTSTLKAINIYNHQSNIRHIFALHKKMLQSRNKNVDDTSKFATIQKTNRLLARSFSALYFATWVTILLQTIASKPADRLWSSTYNLPYEFAKSHTIYVIVLFYQGFSNMLFAVWIALEDTFPIILILMLIGHVDRLKKRLEHLALRSEGDIFNLKLLYYRQLKECCVYYEHCLG